MRAWAMMVVVLGVVVLGGCGTVYRRGVDPDAKWFAKVVGIEGKVLQLEDGRRVEIGGVDVESLSAPKLKIFEATLRRLVTDEPVLVRPIPNTRWVRVEKSVWELPTCLAESWAFAPLARIEYISPGHSDVVQYLLGDGCARARLPGLPEELRDRYLEAEALAKSQRAGIWRPGGETRDAR